MKEKKAIRLKNCVKIYINNQHQKCEVLKNVSYQFEYGKFYAIMGRSGSGKTTLINLISTLDKATKGKIYIDENDIDQLSEIEISELRNKQIGLIFQDYMLNKNLKAYENIMIPMFLNNNIKREDRKKKSINLLKEVELVDKTNNFPNELSGGEQQRVSIARALANNPNIILADEPTGNLDKENAVIVFQLLKKMANNGKCVIVVSHDDLIKKYADKILNLNGGKIHEIKR